MKGTVERNEPDATTNWPKSPPAGQHRPPPLRATVPALEAMLYQRHPGAGSRLRPRDRLHGRRRGGGAGRPRLLRPGHAPGIRGCRADPLSDAPPAHHAVRDVRDQIPREAADFRGAPMDPPPHRQRERIFRALFHPGPGILHARARAPRRAIRRQPPGPRRRADRRGGRRGAGPAARRRHAARYDHYAAC